MHLRVQWERIHLEQRENWCQPPNIVDRITENQRPPRMMAQKVVEIVVFILQSGRKQFHFR